MKLLAAICAALIAAQCFIGLQQNSGGGVQAWPVAHPEVMARNINEIPQWHCLRYFKHDIHLMRRCRNQRFPMIRRIVSD